MMKKFSYIIIIFSLVFSQYRDVPDEVNKVATSAGNWLKLETGTRAIAMSGAHVAAGRGVSSIPYNPANVAYIKSPEVFYSRSWYLAGISHNVLGYSMMTSPTDFLSMHLFYLNSGDMEITTEEEPNGTGRTFNVANYCLRANYAKIVTDRLKIGSTLKFIYEDVHTVYMSSLAFDIGSNFDTGIAGTVLGMSVTNFGTETQFKGEGLKVAVDDSISPTGYLEKKTNQFLLPLTFNVGVMWDIPLKIINNAIKAEEDAVSMILAFDMSDPMDYDPIGRTGIEFSYKDQFFVRMGMHQIPVFGSLLGMKLHDTARGSFGFGLSAKNFSVDYAYSNFDALESTHQFGLSYRFKK